MFFRRKSVKVAEKSVEESKLIKEKEVESVSEVLGGKKKTPVSDREERVKSKVVVDDELDYDDSEDEEYGESLDGGKKDVGDIATDFLISGLSENVAKLIKKAKKSGVVSRADVERASELDGLSPDEAEDAIVRISEIGVNVKEEYDEDDELSMEEGNDYGNVGRDYDDDDNVNSDDANNKMNGSDDDDDDYDLEEQGKSSDAMRNFLATHQEEDDAMIAQSALYVIASLQG